MCERVHPHSQTHARMHAHTMQILVLGGTGPSHIPAGQTRDITSNVDRNLDNAASIEYELVED